MSKIKYVSSSGLTHYDEKIKKVIDEVDTSTNTKVTQTPTSTDASYPLLLSPSGQTQETNTTSYFNSGVVLNPSTKTISANIDGNSKTATKATSADSATKATQDASGNVITDTYAEKETIALKSTTGTSISVADSKEAPMILNDAPINLAETKLLSFYKYGIAYSTSGDLISISGTATEQTDFRLYSSTNEMTHRLNLKAGTYRFSSNQQMPANVSLKIYAYIDNTNVLLCTISTGRKNTTFALTEETGINIILRVENGTTVDVSGLRFMIEKDARVYNTPVPYTGYDITACGKNLINGVFRSTYYATRCSYELSNDNLIATATGVGWSGIKINFIGLKPNTKYTISTGKEPSRDDISCGIANSKENVNTFSKGASELDIITDESDSNGILKILFCVSNDSNANTGDYIAFKNIMLVEGDTALDYEPSVISSVKVNSKTVFPVSGLESYDGVTHVINKYSPNMQVTYATNEAGQGILKEIETKAEINGSNATGDWNINITGNSATATKATSADSATKATQDGNGNVITDTYAKKSIYGDTVVSMGRKADTTVGTNSFAFGNNVTASGDYSCAFGNNNIASSIGTFAAGMDNEVSSTYSAVFGLENIVSNAASLTQGRGNTVTGIYSLVNGLRCTGLQNQLVHGHHNNTTTATENSYNGTSDGTAFVIGNGTSSSKSNAFRVTGKGVIYATNATVQTGADYAEYFEWSDGNPNEEDRVGYFVTFDEDNPEKIRIANEDDYILGIVSGMPNIIGNGDECWKQRYILDDFGRYIEETFEYEVEVPEVVEKEVEDEETGETKIVEEVVTHKETKIGTKWKENPEYDQTKAYIPRDKRAEWSAIGMLGVLSVRDDGTCQVNGYCKCTDGGIATACEKGEGYRIIKRVTDNVVKVVLK